MNNVGVRQGGMLSVYLFSFHINVGWIYHKKSCQAYADDSEIYYLFATLLQMLLHEMYELESCVIAKKP